MIILLNIGFNLIICWYLKNYFKYYTEKCNEREGEIEEFLERESERGFRKDWKEINEKDITGKERKIKINIKDN